MKKTLLSLKCFGLAVAVNAQAPITSWLNPSAGFNYFVKYADTTGITAGPGGANQTWNFTINATGLPTAVSFMAPAGTPYQSAFPMANLAQNAGTGSFAYYTMDNDEYTFHGLGTTAYNMIYTDPETYFSYPMNYNVMQSDDFSGGYTYGVAPDTISMNVYGSHTATYDGYGTLVVNGHTYNDVIRIYGADDITYSNVNLPYLSNSHNTTYVWFQTGNPEALLSIATSQNTGFAATKTVSVSTLITGIEDVAGSDVSGIALYPSVVSDSDCSLIISSEKKQDGTASIYNNVGQLVSATDFAVNAGTGIVELPTSGLVKGMYFVRVNKTDGTVSEARKLLVQ